MSTAVEARSIGNAEGPHVLITAGVHGDEFEPMVAVRRLWEQLRNTPVRGRITFVPIVNRPAFLLGQRVGKDGRDLARTMPGRSDGSDTEQIAASLTRVICEADYLIDLHTGGRLFRILPLAGYTLHPNTGVLATQRAMARAFNCPIVWGTSPNLDGRTLSVARDENIPAIYVEAGGGGAFDENAVRICVEGCLNVLGHLDVLDRPAPESQVQHVVEDPRDASGYLQVQQPSPASGFFEPFVALGERVNAGQPWGRIVDEFGDTLGDVPAGESGLALFLRAVPCVQAGESTGGVLPVP